MTPVFEAHSSITDPELRRQSVLLGRSLAVVTALFACVDIALVLTVPGYVPPWIGYGVLLFTFALNRAGVFRLAAMLATALFSVVAFALVYSGRALAPSMTLSYLALSPMLGTFFLPVWGVAALTALNLVGIVVAYFVAPGLHGQSALLIGAFSSNAMLGALAAFYMHHRNRVEADRTTALERSEERLRLALDAARLGIWELCEREGRVTLDERARAILGAAATRPELAAAFADSERPALQRALSQALDGSSRSFSLVVTPAAPFDGQVELTGQATRDERGARVIGTVLDVSARRRLEVQLRQAQKMEALGRLGGGIAHDFNNVLMVILGNTALLRRRDPHALELQRIEAAASSAAVLTRQLLAFGRNAVLETRVIDLASVVRGATAMMGRLIGEDIEIACQAEEAWPAKLDQGLIEQVLLNLATNARDAMPAGGTLRVEVVNETLGEGDARLEAGRTAGDYVRVGVADDGHGMDAATCQRIFEPFFTTKERGKGTGLGLAMVFGTVSQSGGFITVSSAPGRGTRFDLYFPRTLDVAPVMPEPEAPRVRGAETLLLVEDDPAVRGVIELILREGGYRVLSASSPLEARELWSSRADEVSLVITDEVMPGGRGTDLVVELRKQRPGLRALSMSGYAELEGEASALEIARIQKPFALDELLRQVRVLLDASGPTALKSMRPR